LVGDAFKRFGSMGWGFCLPRVNKVDSMILVGRSKLGRMTRFGFGEVGTVFGMNFINKRSADTSGGYYSWDRIASIKQGDDIIDFGGGMRLHVRFNCLLWVICSDKSTSSHMTLISHGHMTF
jgi:hypothetical protein